MLGDSLEEHKAVAALMVGKVKDSPFDGKLLEAGRKAIQDEVNACSGKASLSVADGQVLYLEFQSEDWRLCNDPD